MPMKIIARATSRHVKSLIVFLLQSVNQLMSFSRWSWPFWNETHKKYLQKSDPSSFLPALIQIFHLRFKWMIYICVFYLRNFRGWRLRTSKTVRRVSNLVSGSDFLFFFVVEMSRVSVFINKELTIKFLEMKGVLAFECKRECACFHEWMRVFLC